MNTYKIRIFIRERSYTDWTFIDSETGVEIALDTMPFLKSIDPVALKLFSQDILHITTEDDDMKGVSGTTVEDPSTYSDASRRNITHMSVIHSYIKTCEYIAGVLLLDGNKTYGRNNNKKRLCYRCIPDDVRLPEFLIPYEIKTGFSKVFKNKYVVFRYDSWDDKHPSGVLIETIGDVDKLEAFYEYQLYCKNLHISIKDLTDKTRATLSKKTRDQFVDQIFRNPQYNIQDRRGDYVFTIDPPKSGDFDDGLGIQRMGDDWRVSIYIANVIVWLDTLDLWKSLSRRVSTIYLPDRRRPMLPTILSETLCSLVQNEERFAFVMDIVVSDSGEIKEYTCKNVLINVKRNYAYEDKHLINNDIYYKDLFDLSVKMDTHIKNSHDIVAFWMVMINSLAGELLAKEQRGIFRRVTTSDVDPMNERKIRNDSGGSLNIFRSSAEEYERKIRSSAEGYEVGNLGGRDDIDARLKLLSSDAKRTILQWRREKGEYVLYNDIRDSERKMVHISSPIRRIVDIMNMLEFRELANAEEYEKKTRNANGGSLNLFRSSAEEYGKWKGDLEYINQCMCDIRKIERNSEILRRCIEEDIMGREHSGVIFERRTKNNGLYNYMVYIEDLKMLSKITTEQERDEYTNVRVKIYIYNDEEKLKRKVRVDLVTPVPDVQ